MTHSNTNPRSGLYLTHAHSHITRAVAAMDSCFGFVWPHQHGIAVRQKTGGLKALCILPDRGLVFECVTCFCQSGRTPVLEEAMTSLFYCFARKSQKINPRKIWLSEKLDSRFHRSISENIKASLSNVPWARVGNFWHSESIKSLSFWKGLRRSPRHFDRHRI